MVGRRSFTPLLSAALLLAAASLGFGKTAPGEAPADGRSLAGQLLIAAPGMSDPRFARTVIIMLRHDATGALGVVINRPVAERPLAMLLSAAGESAEGVAGSIEVHYGGPVEPGLGLMVHSAEYAGATTTRVSAQLAMTRSTDVLRDLGRGQGPRRALFVLGYAGWAPGQLEGELARGGWFTAPTDAAFVFEADRDSLWERAMARRPREM
jgi:putative transcriptional regulator